MSNRKERPHKRPRTSDRERRRGSGYCLRPVLVKLVSLGVLFAVAVPMGFRNVGKPALRRVREAGGDVEPGVSADDIRVYVGRNFHVRLRDVAARPILDDVREREPFRRLIPRFGLGIEPFVGNSNAVVMLVVGFITELVLCLRLRDGLC